MRTENRRKQEALADIEVSGPSGVLPKGSDGWDEYVKF